MQELQGLIDKLYEASTDPDKWGTVLEEAVYCFGARGAQIGHGDLVNARMTISRIHGYDWSTEHIRRYESLMGEDLRLAYFHAHPFQAVHCRMAMTDEELHGSRLYQEVLSVGEVEYTLGVNLVDCERSVSYFLIMRDASMPPFAAEDCEKLNQLIPHLARVLRIHQELGSAVFERQLAFSALDGMALGFLVVNAQGYLRFANPLAQRMLGRGDGLKQEGYLLKAMTDNGVDIQTHIREVTGAMLSSSERLKSRALRVERLSGASPYYVVMSPYKAEQGQILGDRRDERLVVLLVRDPDHEQETRVEVLQRLYGLTAREAHLTELLASGLPLKKGASNMGITVSTARHYVKQVFRKTGVQRQADLVRKVLALPPRVSPGASGDTSALS